MADRIKGAILAGAIGTTAFELGAVATLYNTTSDIRTWPVLAAGGGVFVGCFVSYLAGRWAEKRVKARQP